MSAMRFVIAWVCWCGLGILACVGFAQTTQAKAPASRDAPLSAFDDLVNGLLAKWRIPGAAIGVSHDGRLVLARGYGMADVEAGRPVQPDSLFRIGGISKTITAAAILRLVDEGKLSLDDPIPAGSGATTDSRAGKVSVRQLLQRGVEQPLPANCDDIPGDAPAPRDRTANPRGVSPG